MATIFATILLTVLLLLMPGLAFLRLSGTWSDWRYLQRIALAIGLGLTFFPILFYALRFFAPHFRIQGWMGWLLLFMCSGVTLSRASSWRLQLKRYDLWLIAGLVLLVAISRIWIVWDRSYPAWTDSLHHTLLTKLTAEQGQLPASLEPYLPVPLQMYHLGLYSVSGLVTQMLNLPAHTGLLWTAQTLNILSIVGVFLVLDRFSGRIAAIIGILVVGLLSHQPAFYANWGRYTQLSSQALMLLAWVMVIDVVDTSLVPNATPRKQVAMKIIVAGAATAAVLLYHFRGAIFYLLLLVPSLLFVWWRAKRAHCLRNAILRSVFVATVALVTVMPAVWPAMQTWLDLNHAAVATPVATPEAIRENEIGFFAFNLSSFSTLSAHTWLLLLAALSAAYGAWRRNSIVWLSIAWFGLLMLAGNIYLLGVPQLNVTNLGAILIMLYMPIALVIGAAFQELCAVFPPRRVQVMQRYGALLLLVIAIPFVWLRSHDVEPLRFFVTPADEEALTWLADYTDHSGEVAINTTFWLPTSPHGIDAGYWIPYFTEQQTNTGVMISSLGGVQLVKRILADSALVKQAVLEPQALDDLYERGYRYLYIGALSGYDESRFNADTFARYERAAKIYDRNGVTIFMLTGPPS